MLAASRNQWRFGANHLRDLPLLDIDLEHCTLASANKQFMSSFRGVAHALQVLKVGVAMGNELRNVH
jgi:hypothetical protein